MEGLHLMNDQVDLKDAYFAIPLHGKDRTFQGSTGKERCTSSTAYHSGCRRPSGIFTKTTKPVVTVLRTLGMRIIIYIDDILVMATSRRAALEHTECLLFLLENLGFTINRQKSLIDPAQEMEFLGFISDSVRMKLKLLGSKIKNIRWLRRQGATPSEPTYGARGVETSGKTYPCKSRNNGCPPPPLFFKHLQFCLHVALEPLQDYSKPCPLTEEAKEELTWWIAHPNSWNGKMIIRGEPDITIQKDASKTGWGARCGNLQTDGPWSPKEATTHMMHINCLELLAATFAIQTFAKKQDNLLIHLKMDSTSALTFINKMGGTVSPELNRITKELWSWCLAKNITLKASHLPGSLNEKADEETRIMKDRSDLMLCPKIFRTIQTQFGPLGIDLFASRLSKQLPMYVSWRPDPEAIQTNAFSMNWKGWRRMPTRHGTWLPESWAKSDNRKQPCHWLSPSGRLKHRMPHCSSCWSRSLSCFPGQNIWPSQLIRSTDQTSSPS